MDEIEYTRFNEAMNAMGKLFVEKLKDALQQKYNYAPGYKGDAYSKGRKGTFGGMSLQGSAPKIDTGGLSESISYEYDADEEILTLKMFDYWQNVNYGRTPGFYVPTKPLQAWAMRKFGLDEKEALGAAFGISKNIYKFGIQPTHFYDVAAEEMINIMEEVGAEALGVDVETFFEKTIEEIIPSTNLR